jgi:type I restriction-modification system DNA methylase subunit/restriction endonuclease S subunit
MTKQYYCELCKKEFNQKIDLTRHKKKKTPCISIDQIQELTQTKEINMDNKTSLINLFKSCLNILRDNEGLTGEKALRNMSYLLILKLIEPHLGSEIDIDNYDYDFSSYFEEDFIEPNKKRLLSIVRFSNLSKENDDNIPNIMKYAWDVILSVHPTTKNIFLKGKGFDIQHKSTYKNLIDKLNSFDFTKTEYDILGNAYEEVIQDIMTGKVLGQFFTQPLIKNMMVKLIDPQIYPDGTMETCGDPTMGTGGFLITYLKHILEQAKRKDINLDWNFIKTTGLYGKEIEPDTYQLAVSNMLISSGHMFENLERGDSIRDPITKKFDNILANPPFGIKGLIYDEIKSSLRDEYIPIKSDNAVSLFIQAIIYMLKINGKCAVVIPDGQDLFSKTNNTLVRIREFLMKTCDLKEVIYLPSGIFNKTSIKTCVFYFIKKKYGSEVLEVKINDSKNKKEDNREYKFSKTHQTNKVKFFDYNPYEEIKNLLIEVPIDRIVRNSYSLNYAEYLKDDTQEEQYEDGIVVKTLGEVCEFQNGSQLDKKDIVEGNIPIFGGGVKIVGFHNSHNRNGNETIICGTGVYSGYVNHNYGKPFWASQCFTMKSKNINIMIDKYLYYYSKIILESCFMSNQKGTAIPFIRYPQVIGVKIPIPSPERQQEIVKYLDFIYEKANKTSYEKIAELKQLNEFCLNNQKIFGENVVKTLGEVCSINYGTRIVKSKNIEGEYPVYGSGRAMFSTNTYNREGYNILIGRFALSLECVRIINDKIFLNDSGLSVKPKIDNLLHKYIGYYLLHNKNIIYNCARGTAQQNLEIDIFKSIKIHIPSVERQKEIVEYCEYNDTLIKQLEGEIENNKKQAEQFIKNILISNCQNIYDQEDDILSVNSESIHDESSSNIVSSVDTSSVEVSSNEEELPIEHEIKKVVKKIRKKLVIKEDK